MKVVNWSADKNRLLINDRGVPFDEAVFHIQAGELLHDIVRPNASSNTSQRLLAVLVRDCVYLVPYVEDEKQILLTTIIPSRKFTKLYLGGAG